MSPTPQQRATIQARHRARVERIAGELGIDTERIDPDAPAPARTVTEALVTFNVAVSRVGDELAAAAANDLARIGRVLRRR